MRPWLASANQLFASNYIIYDCFFFGKHLVNYRTTKNEVRVLNPSISSTLDDFAQADFIGKSVYREEKTRKIEPFTNPVVRVSLL